MNEIYNHKTISFCWPFGPRDSGPVGKLIIPHLRRYQGFAVVHYSVTLDALSEQSGDPVAGVSGASLPRRVFDLDFRSIGVACSEVSFMHYGIVSEMNVEHRTSSFFQ